MTAETDIYEKVDENTEYHEPTEVKTAEQDIYYELKWTQLHVEEVEISPLKYNSQWQSHCILSYKSVR